MRALRSSRLASGLAWSSLAVGLLLAFDANGDDPVKASENKPPVAASATPQTDPAIEEMTNSIGMKLVKIRAGNFLMGAPDSDKNVPPYERPQHRVRIRKPFYFGKFEVTNAEFRKFSTDSGYMTECGRGHLSGAGYVRERDNRASIVHRNGFSWRNTGYELTDEMPVVNVTWKDAQEFCSWLSKKEKKTYRLPTEAEWEWCCRAGTIERFYFGDDHSTLKGKINLADASLKAEGLTTPHVDWNDGFAFAAPVGKFPPNRFGLYDMHGNVREWCSDWFDYNGKYYEKSPVHDPQGPAIGEYGVSRGGSWLHRPAACRSASRIWHSRQYPSVDLGFRVLCEIVEKE